ncbi:MAG: metal-dependent hydrolase [Candidatus Hydrothermota bacterium]|nr:MAG: metal-dependent hydrolase [Candidatus Hydrothermae bacterium]
MARFGGVKVTWFGHSAFGLTSVTGKFLLIDPWIGNPSATRNFQNQIERIDLILITHGHGDHIGDTIALAKKHNPTVLAIYEVANYLQSKGVKRVVGMNKGGTYVFGGIKATMVDASHSSTIIEGGRAIPGGEAAGFIVEFENGFKVYHMGDTGLFGGLTLIAEFYKPNLVLIPIGGLFTFGPENAAFAIKILKPDWIIPMHYETFPALTGTPRDFKEALPPEFKDRVIVLKPGETAE